MQTRTSGLGPLDQDPQFEERKQDHLRISLGSEVEAGELSDIDRIALIHEAVPELDFEDVSIVSNFFGEPAAAPFFVSSMTAGHSDGEALNLRIARVSAERKWVMGVGSQRKELSSTEAALEWKRLRREVPKIRLLGNVGLAQLIRSGTESVLRLADSIEAIGFFIHLNSLQEALQQEGTPQFRGGLKAIEEFVKRSQVPVLVKETGCGMSQESVHRLAEVGVACIDVAGAGGTHWGRVEGLRNSKTSEYSKNLGYSETRLLAEAAQTFAGWGIGTLEALSGALAARVQLRGRTPQDASQRASYFQIWASGGVRNGLQAAQLLAFGADRVGFAKPVLSAAVKGEEELDFWMRRTEFELRLALFCTGNKDLSSFAKKKVWRWKSQTV